jgi:hypothetical protein
MDEGWGESNRAGWAGITSGIGSIKSESRVGVGAQPPNSHRRVFAIATTDDNLQNLRLFFPSQHSGTTVTFEEATRKAALAARDAVNRAMRQYRQRRVWDEDDLTGVLVGQLDAALSNLKTGGLTWDAAMLRH